MNIRVRTFLLLWLTAHCASSAVYYVDRAAGSDKQDGLTPSTAWQSLGRIAGSPLGAGDYVLLHRGQSWAEPLLVTISGFADAPVTFGAYASGPRPIIDGTGLQLSGDALVMVLGAANIVLAGLDIRNSSLHGLSVNGCYRVVLRDLSVSNNRRHGIILWNSNSASIEATEVTNNGLDTSSSWDGVRIDGGTTAMSDFTVRNCLIHGNIGGEGWNSDNGIFLGHTGTNPPTLQRVRITGNEVWSNGNPDQNQAGRGITGTFQGDVALTGNYIHQNASAGVYLGDYGLSIDITISKNLFYNNALRQFGGTTEESAQASRNTILVDDPSIVAMGAEVGGSGPWSLTNNTFYYSTSTTGTWRGFIGLNDASQQQVFSSDWNLFYSAGPQRWKLSDGIAIGFQQWQAAGFDPHSVNPQ
jgi:hypothetical protein